MNWKRKHGQALPAAAIMVETEEHKPTGFVIVQIGRITATLAEDQVRAALRDFERLQRGPRPVNG